MPIYCHRCPSGHAFEDMRPCADYQKVPQCPECGQAAPERDYRTEQCAHKRPEPGIWPMYSDAMGCHDTQIPTMVKMAKKKGVRVDFTSDGRAILHSPKHRKAVARAFKFYDRNAGYGDPEPLNR